jgi:hypothetical protein
MPMAWRPQLIQADVADLAKAFTGWTYGYYGRHRLISYHDVLDFASDNVTLSESFSMAPEPVTFVRVGTVLLVGLLLLRRYRSRAAS